MELIGGAEWKSFSVSCISVDQTRPNQQLITLHEEHFIHFNSRDGHGSSLAALIENIDSPLCVRVGTYLLS
ncbi:hypothetical protein NQZ68_039283 [Dissostichus eleginoides]|nr:hypothetical protein NQZ68_039283 [Dissostichus eleginoides]